MAQEMLHALTVAERILLSYENSRVRLWYPRVTMAWLGIAPPTVAMDDRAAIPDDPVPIGDARRLSATEAQQGLVEHLEIFQNSKHAAVARAKIRASDRFPGGWDPWTFSVYRLWSSTPILRARLALSPLLRSFTHSTHLQHAFKNALGVMLLSLPAFFPEGSPGRNLLLNCYFVH